MARKLRAPLKSRSNGLDNEDRETQIRRRAYELWEGSGRPAGRALEHWLAAENEFLGMERGDNLPAVGGSSPGSSLSKGDFQHSSYGKDMDPGKGDLREPRSAALESPASECVTSKVDTQQDLPLGRPVSDN